jgi:NAD(P)-dependent dehydrogenase (short-subunit alcohol dehydrogenase family)
MPELPTDPAGPASPGERQRPRSSLSLAGQPALVTGANSGIGRAVALALANAGADVVVNYVVDRPAAEEVAHQVELSGRRSLAIKADVSNEAEVVDMFAKAIDHFGTLHIAVNNAGLQRDAPFTDMTLEQWNKVIGVNLTGQFLCAREAVREFRRRGIVPAVSGAVGKLIFMSSVHQEIPWAGHAVDAQRCAGGGTVRNSSKRGGSRRDPHPDQSPGLGNARGVSRSDDLGAVQADRRARRHSRRGRVAGFGCRGLRHRLHPVC